MTRDDSAPSGEHSETTHFGYQRVPAAEKARRVGEVFSSVARRYDVMNDLMSAGLHRLWKRQAVNRLNPRPGMRVLDLAGGTGDLTALIHPRVQPGGEVILSDINQAMLGEGRDRLIDDGLAAGVEYVLADAQRLPFREASFDRVIIGFGLRNVTHQGETLAAMRRVLRPGGCAVILEFSSLYIRPLRPLYDLYSFGALPLMGRLVTNDADSYRYLAESIRMHPDQQTLKAMMAEAGFEDCDYLNLCAGVVAIHWGYVY